MLSLFTNEVISLFFPQIDSKRHFSFLAAVAATLHGHLKYFQHGFEALKRYETSISGALEAAAKLRCGAQSNP